MQILSFSCEKSETCGGDIEKKEVELVFFSSPPFFLSWREKGLGGLLEGSLFPVIKLTLSLPRAVTEPQPGTFLTGLEETPSYKQWGEGRESNALARGADDFLIAGFGLVL